MSMVKLFPAPASASRMPSLIGGWRSPSHTALPFLRELPLGMAKQTPKAHTSLDAQRRWMALSERHAKQTPKAHTSLDAQRRWMALSERHGKTNAEGAHLTRRAVTGW